jgi:mycofactocin precursor peptide peptidase
MSAFLADVTWPDVERDARDAALAVPIGSTEQHGPHLPLSTDTDVAVALAGLLARARPTVVVAPALPYGSSGEHEDFAGTLSIGQQALELALVELCRSASATFQRILLINAHGGNAEPLDRAQRRLRRERRDVRAWAPSWAGDAHAGRTETSLMLALAPEHVRRDRAGAGNVAPVSSLLPRLRTDGVRAVSPNGVLGDPAGASAHEGRKLLHAASEEMVAMLDTWQRRL